MLFSIPITKLYWRNCEIKMIPIRITLVKWWWTTRNGRRETQCSSTLSGCLYTWPIRYCCLQLFQMRYFVVHFWSKITTVPSPPAKWILFLNHRNRKVVGGKHNVLIHYLDICAPDPSSVVLCGSLFIISDQKSNYPKYIHCSQGLDAPSIWT